MTTTDGKNGGAPNDTGEDADSAPLEHIVEQAIDLAEDGEVTLGALMRALGDRSYGPIIMALGLVAATPLAAFPGAAGVLALPVIALAAQMILGRAHPWLPRRLLRMSVQEERLRETYARARPWLERIDSVITRRWAFMTSSFVRRIAAVCILFLAALMIPLETIPFVVGAPASGVAVFGAAIAARDGLLMSLAFAITLGAAWLSLRLVL